MHSAEPEKKRRAASADGGGASGAHETEEKLKELEQVIGVSFHNKELLRQALSHSSYANEHRAQDVHNNERLEFLGDAVLELVSSKFLYLTYPEQPEGDLTKLRASIVCEPTLALCARQFHLPDYLLLGKGEERTGGRRRNSIVSDALEALIGAIFYDSKTILQEVVQREYPDQELVYRLIKEEGPDHDKHFETAVMIGEKMLGTGRGSTKKGAEMEAAYKALIQLKKE